MLAENQETLASMKTTVDGLAGAARSLKGNERLARAIEGDTKKIYAGIEEMRARSESVVGAAGRAASPASRAVIAGGGGVWASATGGETSKSIPGGMQAARGDSAMMARIAGRIDEIAGGLREMSAKTEAALAAGRQIEEIGRTMRSLDKKMGRGRTGGAGWSMREEEMAAEAPPGGTGDEAGSASASAGIGIDGSEEPAAVAAEVAAMREEVERAARSAQAPASAAGKDGGPSASAVAAEVAAMREQAERAASRADAAIAAVAAEVAAMRGQVELAASRAGEAAGAAGEAAGGIKESAAAAADARADAASSLAGRIGSIESKLGTLAERAGAPAPADGSAGAVESRLARLRDDLASIAGGIERRIDSLADAASRSEASASEFRARADAALGGLRVRAEEAGGASEGPSTDMMALLRLSEYESGMRMRAESKYGGAAELGEMASRTARIASLLEGIAGGRGGADGAGGALPLEVRQWAASKILECADRWDVRFSDALRLLVSGLGREAAGEAVREQQVRDIYGARAVSELRAELGAGGDGGRG